MATTVYIAHYPVKLPTKWSEFSRKQLKSILADHSPRNLLKQCAPFLPVHLLQDSVVDVTATILEWVYDEPQFKQMEQPVPDEWTWQQVEEVRELLVAHPYRWMLAGRVCELLNYDGPRWFDYGCTAMSELMRFFDKFQLVFEGQLTDEEKDAGADALLQFKYYGAADRLAAVWHMTPQRVLQEKAGDCYLKMLYDVTKNKVDDNLREIQK
jgi:hypothetical protein